MAEAPILDVEFSGFEKLNDLAKGHYLYQPVGTPVLLEKTDSGVNAMSCCNCQVSLGHASGPEAATLFKWMSSGWLYTAKVRVTPVFFVAWGHIGVSQLLVLRCEPIRPAKKKSKVEVEDKIDA